jgi:hypothetical protein
MVSNTRVLNLNFNALRDIRPLMGILRLKKLHLAGNRLARLRLTTSVLSQFSGLSLVDMRGNPLTLGFYPPMVETRVVLRQDLDGVEADVQDPFTIGKADQCKDDKYIQRLDMETKMLRRVFEMLALKSCHRLKLLDGLNVARTVINNKDAVWEALIAAGVLSEFSVGGVPTDGEHESISAKGVTLEENSKILGAKLVELPKEERWHAEDSFA